MDNVEYLFAGFAVFWAGLFVYLVMLQLRLRALLREVARLEERLADVHGEVARETAAAPEPPIEPTVSGSAVDPAGR